MSKLSTNEALRCSLSSQVLPQQLTDFVCAPMPFIVGVHVSYMPDELMLDQVVVVDLDKNQIRAPQDDPIAALPERRYNSLIKHLKRLVQSCSWFAFS